jgi:hypothetical protein
VGDASVYLHLQEGPLLRVQEEQRRQLREVQHREELLEGEAWLVLEEEPGDLDYRGQHRGQHLEGPWQEVLPAVVLVLHLDQQEGLERGGHLCLFLCFVVVFKGDRLEVVRNS